MLQEAIAQHGVPEYIRSDNGPEFIAQVNQGWLKEQQIKTIHIEPGCPWQNGYAESFNGRFRRECLNRELIYTLSEGRVVFEDWRRYYNQERPHRSLGLQTPAAFADNKDYNNIIPVHMQSNRPPSLPVPPRHNHPGGVVWLTGLSSSGKTTIARALEKELIHRGRLVCVLDGDSLRRGLCSDLGFSPRDRQENIRRGGEVAKLFAAAGFICIAAFISPYRRDRDFVRSIVPPEKFLEAHLSAPLEICEQRDRKGLYAKARTGEIKEFTGISSPYEPPLKPEIELRTDQLSVTECVAAIQTRLNALSF